MTLVAGTAAGVDRLAFSGGPEGGTFQYFSNGIAIRLSKNIGDVEVSNMASAGSLENLRRVNSGEADFGIVYSGDTYLGRNGKLTNDTRKYPKVMAMAFLYGAPAHLIVKADSGIDKVADLEGKRIAVGGAGSGAAGAAERYFSALGLWDKMNVEFLGYSKAASALGDNLIDAFWVFAGFPNSSVIQAAASNKIKILDVVEAGKAAGFFDAYPFYTDLTIPAGTYTGVDYDVGVVPGLGAVGGRGARQAETWSTGARRYLLQGRPRLHGQGQEHRQGHVGRERAAGHRHADPRRRREVLERAGSED